MVKSCTNLSGCLRRCNSSIRRRRERAIRSARSNPSPSIIGIDPGKSGGISFFADDWVHVEKLPESSNELLELLKTYFPDTGQVTVYLEKIYLPTGKAGALNFASGWGKILAVLEFYGVEPTLVRPQDWMKELDCLTKGDKNVTKAKALELFGDVEYDDGKSLPITHWSSDALLIGYYGYLERKKNDSH